MLVEIALLILSLLAYLAYKCRHSLNHWQRLGVKCAPYEFPFGSNPTLSNDIFLGRAKYANEGAIKQYEQFRGERFYGTYILNNPSLMICDPELVKMIFVKDFNHFVDRNAHTNKFFCGTSMTDRVWSKILGNISGEAWKNLRSSFTPVFTSGKLKGMMVFVREVNARLVESFEAVADSLRPFEVRDKFGKFSMDNIASCAFGVNAQSFTNPDSEFVKNAKEIFRRNQLDFLKYAISFKPIGLMVLKLTGSDAFKPVPTRFFEGVIGSMIKERKDSGKKRNDLLDLMLDAIREESSGEPSKDVDQIALDSKLDHKPNKEGFNEETVIANILMLLAAGYETTSQTMSLTAFELARNPDVQRRLQDEIDEALEGRDDSEIDYGTVQGMEYLDMVFHETLRRHTVGGFLNRTCVKPYVIPGSNIEIQVGEEIYFNTPGMHLDAKYFPEPEKFNPEHFSKESKAKRHPYAYLGFGQGPRQCLGMRFAMLEVKMGLIALLSKFNFVQCNKDEVSFNSASPLEASKDDGLYIKVERRN